jgi:DNA-directed RNA polymerase subunit omega
MDLIQGFDSNYRYVLVAARRARQLLSGARPQIETSTRKPCKVAMEEIQAGKVKWDAEERRTAAEVAGDLLEKAVVPAPTLD